MTRFRRVPLLVLLDGPARSDHETFRHVPAVATGWFAGASPRGQTAAGETHTDRMLDVLGALAVQEPAPRTELALGVVIGTAGTGTAAALAAGLRWAAELSADVVAVPSGLRADRPDVRKAATAVSRSGATLVAAAGNPFAGQRRPLHPAAYAGVVGVGASCYAASYLTWHPPPDVVLSDVPGCAVTLGTSGACIVAAWRRLHEPPTDRP